VTGPAGPDTSPIATGWLAGLRLAASLLTVLPLGYRPPDEVTAHRAARLQPVVGAGLGLLAAGVLRGLVALQAPALLAGVLTVAVLVLITRGMHIDGLADTTDALGSYRGPEGALAIMKSPEVGPFGVAALVLVLGLEVAGFAALAGTGRWLAAGVAVAAGRVAMSWACRRGLPAARPNGLGAMWADSVPVPVAAGWAVLAAVVAAFAVPHRPWQGPLAVLLSVAAIELLGRHARRRFGGSTGDVMGASGELATALAVAVFALGAA
jgi:adenosylcobinamide-GDP ribazoletransferase